MDFVDLKLNNLGIDKKEFGKICTFVDFGNVNFWYEKDRRDWNENTLKENEKLVVEIEKLAKFIRLFSEQRRFYYGWHKRIKRSWHIVIWAEKNGFIKITKPIQFIKHYLDDIELQNYKKYHFKEDREGKFIEIAKSNFDVEISVDAIRLLNDYETFCLFSGDSDFAKLTQFLKRKGKKIIIVASGQVFHTLKETADLYINAQQIKENIADIKILAP